MTISPNGQRSRFALYHALSVAALLATGSGCLQVTPTEATPAAQAMSEFLEANPSAAAKLAGRPSFRAIKMGRLSNGKSTLAAVSTRLKASEFAKRYDGLSETLARQIAYQLYRDNVSRGKSRDKRALAKVAALSKAARPPREIERTNRGTLRFELNGRDRGRRRRFAFQTPEFRELLSRAPAALREVEAALAKLPEGDSISGRAQAEERVELYRLAYALGADPATRAGAAQLLLKGALTPLSMGSNPGALRPRFMAMNFYVRLEQSAALRQKAHLQFQKQFGKRAKEAYSLGRALASARTGDRK